MKKYLICISLIVSLLGYAVAEVIYLKDGQIIKGNILSQNKNFIKIKTQYADITIDKAKVKNINFDNTIDNNTNDEDYQEYKWMKKRKEKKIAARKKSIVSFGSGIGLPYGLIGSKAEILLSNNLALTLGYDQSEAKMITFGALYYFGKKSSAFRTKIGCLFGDTHVTMLGYKNVKTQGKYPFVGFQWKFASWLSLDFDVGYAMHDEHQVTSKRYYSYDYWTRRRRSYVNTYNFSNGIAPAIGLIVHF